MSVTVNPPMTISNEALGRIGEGVLAGTGGPVHVEGTPAVAVPVAPSRNPCAGARTCAIGHRERTRSEALTMSDRPRLAALKPRLQAGNLARLPTLDTKAGATEMERGRAWMAKRQRIALAHGYLCAGCGLIWRSHLDQIDHIVPREQGGSNEDSNLQPLCNACHLIKTADEAQNRAGIR